MTSPDSESASSALGVGHNVKGIALGGVGVGAGNDIEGFALGLGTVRAEHKLTGGAVSLVSVAAPSIHGITLAGLNGIGFRDMLQPEKVNERYTGVALGLINYTRELHGIQVGVLNYAANNPPWARLLPFVNLTI